LRVPTKRKLADELGRSQSYLSQLSLQPWFPKKHKDGWDVDECREAISKNTRFRKKPSPTGVKTIGPKKIPISKGRKKSASSDAEVLSSHGSSTLERARAAVRVTSAAMATAVNNGDLDNRIVDALKKSLEECRRTEEGMLTMQERRGELIKREVAKGVIGRITSMCCGLLANAESVLANQVEVWISDPDFTSMATENRGRAVRAWWHSQVYSLRELGAEQFENMIREEQES